VPAQTGNPLQCRRQIGSHGRINELVCSAAHASQNDLGIRVIVDQHNVRRTGRSFQLRNDLLELLADELVSDQQDVRLNPFKLLEEAGQVPEFPLFENHPHGLGKDDAADFFEQVR
jgi:hypothetical protein